MADLISRAELKEKVLLYRANNEHACLVDKTDVLEDMETIIDLAPAVEAGPKWIPVAERLPENDVWVLVCKQDIKTGWMSMAVDRCILTVGGDRLWLNDYASWKTVLTHWMPLPDPPKEV